jgi:hypothetical protein
MVTCSSVSGTVPPTGSRDPSIWTKHRRGLESCQPSQRLPSTGRPWDRGHRGLAPDVFTHVTGTEAVNWWIVVAADDVATVLRSWQAQYSSAAPLGNGDGLTIVPLGLGPVDDTSCHSSSLSSNNTTSSSRLSAPCDGFGKISSGPRDYPRQIWLGLRTHQQPHDSGCCMCHSRSYAATRLSSARRSLPPGPLDGRRTMNSRTSSRHRATSISS